MEERFYFDRIVAGEELSDFLLNSKVLDEFLLLPLSTGAFGFKSFH
jgi:hypothetical protein